MDEVHNTAIEVCQAFIRKQAIGYAMQHKDKIFEALEEIATAMDSLKKESTDATS